MQRAIIDRLPKEIRKQLDKKLVENGFRNYVPLAEWLSGQGYEIRKSAVHSHGQKLQKRLAAIKLATSEAQAVVAASPDEDNAMNDALVRLVQERIFNLLTDMEIEDIDSVKLTKIARGIADVGRASISQKKYIQEMRAKIAANLDKKVEEARSSGIDPQILQRAKELVRGAIDESYRPKNKVA